MNKHRGFSKSSQKFCSLFLILSFAFTNITFSPETFAAAESNPVKPQNLESFQIPAPLGRIDAVLKGGPQTIILLQDAHAEPGAQLQLRELTEHVIKKYGIRLVGLEGASGSLDRFILETFPDADILEQVLKSYLDQGELSGPSLAGLQDAEADFYGLEQQKLFEKGINYLLSALTVREKLHRKLHGQEIEIVREKNRLYSPELRVLDEKIRNVEEGREGYFEALTDVLDTAAGILGGTVLADYPHLAALRSEIAVQQREGAGVDAQLKSEILKAADALKKAKTLSSIETKQLNGDLQGFQTGQLSAGAMAASIAGFSEAHPGVVTIRDSVQRAARSYRILEDARGEKLLEEFHSLSNRLKEKLLTSHEARLLAEKDERLYLLKQLTDLKLSRSGWKKVQSFSDLEDFSDAVNFYNTAAARDAAMAENAGHYMKDLKQKAMLIAAGGFHTEGLLERFSQKGYTVILISPRFQKAEGEGRYEKLMQGGVSWKEDFIVRSGTLDLYEAFHRHLTRQLSAQASHLAKPWRDNMLRELASQKRISESSRYTVWPDSLESSRGNALVSTEARRAWLSKIWNFTNGLKHLESANNLKPESLVSLARQSTPVWSSLPWTHRRVPAAWASGAPVSSRRSELRSDDAPQAIKIFPRTDLKMNVFKVGARADKTEAPFPGFPDVKVFLSASSGDQETFEIYYEPDQSNGARERYGYIPSILVDVDRAEADPSGLEIRIFTFHPIPEGHYLAENGILKLVKDTLRDFAAKQGLWLIDETRKQFFSDEEPEGLAGFGEAYPKIWAEMAAERLTTRVPDYLSVRGRNDLGKYEAAFNSKQRAGTPPQQLPVRSLKPADFNFLKIKHRQPIADIRVGSASYFLMPDLNPSAEHHALLVSREVRPNRMTEADFLTALRITEKNPSVRLLQNTESFTVNHLHMHVTTEKLPVEDYLISRHEYGSTEKVLLSQSQWPLSHIILEGEAPEVLARKAAELYQTLESDPTVPHWTVISQGRVILFLGDPNPEVNQQIEIALGRNHRIHVLEAAGKFFIVPAFSDHEDTAADYYASADQLWRGLEESLLDQVLLKRSVPEDFIADLLRRAFPGDAAGFRFRSELRFSERMPSWVDNNAPELNEYTVVSRQVEAGIHRGLLQAVRAVFGKKIANFVAQLTMTGGLGALMHDLLEAWTKNGINTVGILPLHYNKIKGIVFGLPDEIKTGKQILGRYMRNQLEPTGISYQIMLDPGDEFREYAKQSRAREFLGKTLTVAVYQTHTKFAGTPLYYLDIYFKDESGKKVRVFDEVYSDDYPMRDIQMAAYGLASEQLVIELQNRKKIREKIIFVDNEVFASLPTPKLPKAIHHHINHTVFRPGIYQPNRASYKIMRFPEDRFDDFVDGDKIRITDAVAADSDVLTGVGLAEHTPVLGQDIFSAFVHKLRSYEKDGVRNTNGALEEQWQSPERRQLIAEYRGILGLSEKSDPAQVYAKLSEEKNKPLLIRFKSQNEWVAAADVAEFLVWLAEDQQNDLWLNQTAARYSQLAGIPKVQDAKALFESLNSDLKEAISLGAAHSQAWSDLERRFGLLRDAIMEQPITSNIRRQVPYKGPEKWVESMEGVSKERESFDERELKKWHEVLKLFEKDRTGLEYFKKHIGRVVIGGRVFDPKAEATFRQIKSLIKTLGLQEHITTIENYSIAEAPVIFKAMAGTVMLSDEFLEASATSMMKALLNFGALIIVWGGAGPEILVFKDRKTGKEIDIFRDIFRQGIPFDKAHDYVREKLRSKEWVSTNGWMVEYSPYELERSNQHGGGRRPSAQSLVKALFALKRTYRHRLARQELQWNVLKSSVRVDMERGQARAHIYLWQEAIQKRVREDQFFKDLQISSSAAEKILAVPTAGFAWKVGHEWQIETSTSGLLNFIAGFHRLRHQGRAAYDALKFHIANNSKGDLFNYDEALFATVKDDPTVKPVLERLAEYEKRATAAVDPDEKIRINLEALDFFERVAQHISFRLFMTYIQTSDTQVRDRIRPILKDRQVKINIVRYLNEHPEIAIPLQSVAKRIKAYKIALDGKSLELSINLDEFTYPQEGPDRDKDKAWTTLYGEESFKILLGDEAVQDVRRVYRVRDYLNGLDYKAYSVAEMLLQGIPVGVKEPLQLLEFIKTEQIAEISEPQKPGLQNMADMIAAAIQGRFIEGGKTPVEILERAVRTFRHRPMAVSEAIREAASLNADQAKQKFGEGNLAPVMAFVAALAPDQLAAIKDWDPYYYEILDGAINSEANRELFTSGEINFHETDRGTAILISRSKVIVQGDKAEKRTVFVPIHFAANPVNEADGKIWFRTMDLGAYKVFDPNFTYSVFDYTIGRPYPAVRKIQDLNAVWSIGVPARKEKSDRSGFPQHGGRFQILEFQQAGLATPSRSELRTVEWFPVLDRNTGISLNADTSRLENLKNYLGRLDENERISMLMVALFDYADEIRAYAAQALFDEHITAEDLILHFSDPVGAVIQTGLSPLGIQFISTDELAARKRLALISTLTAILSSQDPIWNAHHVQILSHLVMEREWWSGFQEDSAVTQVLKDGDKPNFNGAIPQTLFKTIRLYILRSYWRELAGLPDTDKQRIQKLVGALSELLNQAGSDPAALDLSLALLRIMKKPKPGQSIDRSENFKTSVNWSVTVTQFPYKGFIEFLMALPAIEGEETPAGMQGALFYVQHPNGKMSRFGAPEIRAMLEKFSFRIRLGVHEYELHGNSLKTVKDEVPSTTVYDEDLRAYALSELLAFMEDVVSGFKQRKIDTAEGIRFIELHAQYLPRTIYVEFDDKITVNGFSMNRNGEFDHDVFNMPLSMTAAMFRQLLLGRIRYGAAAVMQRLHPADETHQLDPVVTMPSLDQVYEFRSELRAEGGKETFQGISFNPLTSEEEARLVPRFPTAAAFYAQYPQWRARHPYHKVLTLVRHVNSTSNLLGHTQSFLAFSPPTLRGYLQGFWLTRFLSRQPIRFDRAISSDLERAHFTIRGIARFAKLRHEVYQRLREIGSHVIGGVPKDKLTEYRGLLEILLSDIRRFKMPNFDGERVLAYLQTLFLREIASGKAENVIVGSHGITIRLLVTMLLDIPYAKTQAVYKKMGNAPNVGITIFSFDPQAGKWELQVGYDNSYLPSILQGEEGPAVYHFAEAFYMFARAIKRILFRLFTWGPANIVDYQPFMPPFLSPSPSQMDEINRYYKRAKHIMPFSGAETKGKSEQPSVRSELRQDLVRPMSVKSELRLAVVEAAEVLAEGDIARLPAERIIAGIRREGAGRFNALLKREALKPDYAGRFAAAREIPSAVGNRMTGFLTMHPDYESRALEFTHGLAAVMKNQFMAYLDSDPQHRLNFAFASPLTRGNALLLSQWRALLDTITDLKKNPSYASRIQSQIRILVTASDAADAEVARLLKDAAKAGIAKAVDSGVEGSFALEMRHLLSSHSQALVYGLREAGLENVLMRELPVELHGRLVASDLTLEGIFPVSMLLTRMMAREDGLTAAELLEQTPDILNGYVIHRNGRLQITDQALELVYRQIQALQAITQSA